MTDCRCYTVHARIPYREFCSRDCELDYNNRDKWSEKVLRWLLEGRKVYYPGTIICPLINLDLLDFMNDFQGGHPWIDIKFMREGKTGYWISVIQEFSMNTCKECKETFDLDESTANFSSNFCSEDCEEIYHWNLSFGIGEPLEEELE